MFLTWRRKVLFRRSCCTQFVEARTTLLYCILLYVNSKLSDHACSRFKTGLLTRDLCFNWRNFLVDIFNKGQYLLVSARKCIECSSMSTNIHSLPEIFFSCLITIWANINVEKTILLLILHNFNQTAENTQQKNIGGI